MRMAESFVRVYIDILQIQNANLQVHNQYRILKLLGFINDVNKCYRE